MKQIDSELESKGQEVLKQIGAVKEATRALNESVEDEREEHEEVAGWIATVGKALISIFK